MEIESFDVFVRNRAYFWNDGMPSFGRFRMSKLRLYVNRFFNILQLAAIYVYINAYCL